MRTPDTPHRSLGKPKQDENHDPGTRPERKSRIAVDGKSAATAARLRRSRRTTPARLGAGTYPWCAISEGLKRGKEYQQLFRSQVGTRVARRRRWGYGYFCRSWRQCLKDRGTILVYLYYVQEMPRLVQKVHRLVHTCMYYVQGTMYYVLCTMYMDESSTHARFTRLD